MSQLNHPFFGSLDTDSMKDIDVIWEASLEFQNHPVEATLWAEPGQHLETTRLNAFAELVLDLATLDAHARKALVEHLQQDRTFIDYYTDALDDAAEGLDSAQALRDQAEKHGQENISAADFVAALQLKDLGLWCTQQGSPVVLDYRLDPDASDQILAVKCDALGRVITIDWES